MVLRKTMIWCLLAVGLALGAGCQVSVEAPARSGVVVVEEARTVRGTAEVRTCPSMYCDVLMTVYRGWPVRVLGYRDGYAEVVVMDTGVRGWIVSRMLY
jgi:hypothetical protein